MEFECIVDIILHSGDFPTPHDTSVHHRSEYSPSTDVS